MGLPNTLRGGQQRSSAVSIPSATHGVDATSNLSKMDPETCVYTYNLLAEDFGMEVRDGYVEWANGWSGGIGKTVITFEGNIDTEDKLFVASAAGIYDVTIEGETNPSEVVTFPSQGGNAGICSFVNFTNDGNDRFLLVCDGENGYYTWAQSTNTWTKILDGGGPGHINGVDPNDLIFVTIWKTRVWFIQRDSANAWYLDAGAFTGNVTAFNFGDQFRFGGSLVGLYSWTLDGGAGMDDYLVALSGAGDVVVYQGTDPDTPATFGLVGSWYVGETPAGFRVATEFAGELYILSVYGLVAMSRILNGAGVSDPSTYLTNKISPYVRSVMDDAIRDFGWHVHVHPKQSLLFINSPPRVGFEQLAFTAYLGSNAWSMVRGLPKADTGNWRGEIYWTSIDTNKLFIQKGYVDAVYLDPETDGPPQAIEWDYLSAYFAFGEETRYKRAQYIRPMFVSGGVPGFIVQARYDYDLNEVSGSPILTDETAGLWGDAGDAVFAMAGNEDDTLYLQIEAGDAQISGVTTIDVTIDARPLVTLTWSAPNSRYEVVDAGIQTYIIGKQLQNIAVVMNPDTLPSQAYTMFVGADSFSDDVSYGYSQAAFVEDDQDPQTPPVYTPHGTFNPQVILGTAVVTANNGLWDIALWGGGTETSDNPRGANGMGRHIAVSIRGRSSEPTTLVSFDVTIDMGGFM